MKCLCHLECDAVRIDPVGPSLAVKAERRNDRDDSLLEEQFQGMVVDPLHPSGKELVGPAENAGRMRDDRVGVGSPQVDRGKSLHDPVGEPDRRIDRNLKGRVIGDAGSVGVGNLDAPLRGQIGDLPTRPVHEDHPDAQRAKHGEIEQDVGEILGGGHRSIDGNHEDPLPEAGDVLENFAEIGDVHKYSDGVSVTSGGAINLSGEEKSPAGGGRVRGRAPRRPHRAPRAGRGFRARSPP